MYGRIVLKVTYGFIFIIGPKNDLITKNISLVVSTQLLRNYVGVLGEIWSVGTYAGVIRYMASS